MNNINKKTLLASCVAISIGSWHVSAQEAGFTAEVDSRLTHEDNILRASDANAESDTSLVVAPKLTLGAALGKQRFSVMYTGEYANYFDNSDVNYADHDIRLKADFDHSYRLTTRFDAQYRDKHEDFADLNTIFDGFSEFNTYTESLISGRVLYGRQDSFGQLELSIGRTDREYDNNDQEFRSFVRDQLSGRFYYRIAPKTRLLAEAIYNDFEYDPEGEVIDLDSTYVRYSVGVEWALTNQLEGEAKIGFQERDYRVENLQDIDGLSFEVNLDWKPNTFTEIGLVAKRETLDSSLADTGGFLRTTYGVSASHGITERTKVEGQIATSKDELVQGVTRDDDRLYAKVGVLHDLFSWVEIGANLSYESRESNFVAADYDMTSVNLTAKVTLD